MKKIKKIYIIYLFFYLLIFSLLLNNSYNYLDNDLGWHLKVGEEIINTKSMPSVEHYDYTLLGQKWVDHEWLMNAITYWIYNNLGYLALNIFFVLIIILALIVLNKIIYKFYKTDNLPFYIIIFEYLGVYLSMPSFGIRMQEITVLNLVLLFNILVSYSNDKNYKKLFWLIPLFYFWACAHAGFLIGIFILIFYAGIKFIEIIIKIYKNFYFINFEKTINNKSLLIFSFFIIFSILATLITPYGLKIYEFLTTYTNAYFMNNISEWRPFYYYPVREERIIYYAFTFIAFYFIFILSIKKKINGRYKIVLWDYLLALLFFFLSIKARRHFSLFFIASIPLLISFYSINLNFSFAFIKNKFYKLRNILFILLMIFSSCLIFYNLKNTKFTKDPFLSYCNKFPCEGIKFLKENREYLKLRILNSYNFGGYLIWTLPELKLFIDGRLPQFPFAGSTMLEEYNNFFNKDLMVSKLNSYGIELVFFDLDKKNKVDFFEKYIFGYNEKRLNNANVLLEYLDSSGKWEKIYKDNTSVIYIKNKI